MDIGKKYRIIYDDKGFKPVQKIGTIIEIKDNLFKLDSSPDWLNLNLIIRAIPIGGEEQWINNQNLLFFLEFKEA